MIKKLLKLLFIILAIIIIIGFLLYKKYEGSINQTYNDTSQKVEFVIEAGATADQVIDDLANSGLIPEDITTYVKLYFRQIDFPALPEGTFQIPQNLTPKEILEMLQSPESTDVWITIPEGRRKDEIAEIIKNEYSNNSDTVFSSEEFINLTNDVEFISTLGLNIAGLSNLEGYLYPDKYLMPKDATAEYIITTMVNTLIEKVGTEITYEDVIIASMVEREGLSSEDKPLIADIIQRRNNEGWLLQIDATLLYYHKDWKHIITIQDKDLEHPYNTYVYIGYPPTPISNPGIESYNAVTDPTPNSYYYYIHDDTGTVHFASSLGEHESNVQQYLR